MASFKQMTKSEQPPVFVREATGLVRSFGWLDTFWIVSLGFGSSVLTGLAFYLAYYYVVGSGLIASIVGFWLLPFLSCLIWPIMQMSIAMPRSGGIRLRKQNVASFARFYEQFHVYNRGADWTWYLNSLRDFSRSVCAALRLWSPNWRYCAIRRRYLGECTDKCLHSRNAVAASYLRSNDCRVKSPKSFQPSSNGDLRSCIRHFVLRSPGLQQRGFPQRFQCDCSKPE